MSTNSNPKQAIHSGHRNRVRENFVASGLDTFSDELALEMLLYYGIPQKNTTFIAQRLLESYGDSRKVFQASVDELHQQCDMTRNASLLISLLPKLLDKYIDRLCDYSNQETSDSYKIRYILSLSKEHMRESMVVFGLDTLLNIKPILTINSRGLECSKINYHAIIDAALLTNSRYLVIAQRHKNGLAMPTVFDVYLSKFVTIMLKKSGIILYDHLMVGNGKIYSMRGTHLYDVSKLS